MDTVKQTTTRRVISLKTEEEFLFKPEGDFWNQPIRRIEVYRSYFLLFGGHKSRERNQVGLRYTDTDEVPTMPSTVVDEVTRCLDAFWVDGDSVKIVTEMSA